MPYTPLRTSDASIRLRFAGLALGLDPRFGLRLSLGPCFGARLRRSFRLRARLGRHCFGTRLRRRHGFGVRLRCDRCFGTRLGIIYWRLRLHHDWLLARLRNDIAAFRRRRILTGWRTLLFRVDLRAGRGGHVVLDRTGLLLLQGVLLGQGLGCGVLFRYAIIGCRRDCRWSCRPATIGTCQLASII